MRIFPLQQSAYSLSSQKHGELWLKHDFKVTRRSQYLFPQSILIRIIQQVLDNQDQMKIFTICFKGHRSNNLFMEL